MREFNGEPLNFNRQMRLDRAVDQLIGLCSGIVADGGINTEELAFLGTWISEHREVCESFPGSTTRGRRFFPKSSGSLLSMSIECIPLN